MYTKFIFYQDGEEIPGEFFCFPALEQVANHIAKILEKYDKIPGDLLKIIEGEYDNKNVNIETSEDGGILISTVNRKDDEYKIKIVKDEFLEHLKKEKDKIMGMIDSCEKWHIKFKQYEGPVWDATYYISNNQDISKKDARIIVNKFVNYLLNYHNFFEDKFFHWRFDTEDKKIRITFDYFDDGPCREYIELYQVESQFE